MPEKIFVGFANCFVKWQGAKKVRKIKLVIMIKQVVINDNKFCGYHKKSSKMWEE